MHGEIAYTGPFYLNVDVTRRCNLACRGCQHHSSKTRKAFHKKYDVDFISLDLIEKLCSELPYLDTYEVFLAGQGEPLFHPDIDKIIGTFKQAGCLVQSFTNGTLIDDAKAEMLVKSGLDVLRVSLWAVNREEYKKCYTGINPDFLEKTFKGIRTIKRMKLKENRAYPRIILTAPLNRNNWTTLEERVRLANDLGCNGVAFDVYQDWGEFMSDAFSTDEIDLLCSKLSRLKPELKRFSLKHNIDEVLTRYRLGKTAWRQLPCYVGWFHILLRIDGSIVPCCSCTLSMGNLSDNSFTEIWNGPEYRSFRRKMLSTRGTSHFSSDCYCDWCCLGISNFRTYRVFKWIDPLIKIFNYRRNESMNVESS